MAKSIFIRNIDKETAEKACAAWKESKGRYPALTVSDNGDIELYGGNSGERDDCTDFIAAYVTRAKSDMAPESGAPATTRQIGYLETLIDRDPAAAMALNITNEKAAALTKAEASKIINQLENF